MAIQELHNQFPNQPIGEYYLRALRAFMKNEEVPEAVSDAAQRLQTRLTISFKSPSIDPIGDVRQRRIEFVKKQMLARTNAAEDKKNST